MTRRAAPAADVEMSEFAFARRPPREPQGTPARCIAGLGAMLVAIAACTVPCNAFSGTVAVPFLVTAQFTSASTTATCQQSAGGTFGADLTLVCRPATGTVGTGNGPAASTFWRPYGDPVESARFLTRVVSGDTVLGTVDADVASGVFMQWRVIESADRSYVEVGIAW